MKCYICVWLHRGVMPALATRHAGGIHIKHVPLDTEGEWLPVNIYRFGAASPWPQGRTGK